MIFLAVFGIWLGLGLAAAAILTAFLRRQKFLDHLDGRDDLHDG